MNGADPMIKELVILSGKGGTGKTSITASIAQLGSHTVLADCDVDAADLHLILEPRTRHRETFVSGREASIRPTDCTGCGVCLDNCRFGAIEPYLDEQDEEKFRVNGLLCEGCGVCVHFCRDRAIDFEPRDCGEWFVSDSRNGTLVHARLRPGAENSGKLVAIVRAEARSIARAQHQPLVIIDGPPGIGCPAIASVTGATMALVVTEPTVSGLHDVERLLAMIRHFRIPAALCVNKWDINPILALQIEEKSRTLGAIPVGRVAYDPGVSDAQHSLRAATEIDTRAGEDIRAMWDRLRVLLDGNHFEP